MFWPIYSYDLCSTTQLRLSLCLGSNLHREIEAAASDFRSSAERMNLPEFELADENCSSGNLEFNSSYAPVYNLYFPPPKKRLYMEDILLCERIYSSYEFRRK